MSIGIPLERPVYLAYMDDSGTKNAASPYQVVASIVIPDREFINVESVCGMVIENLVETREEREAFGEFHACELYWGTGPFKHLKDDEEKRHKAIFQLLIVLAGHQYPIIYGAVDKQALYATRFSSANPVDIAFRICAEGVEKYMQACSETSGKDERCIVVMDDTDDKRTKQELRRSFRQLRRQQRPPTGAIGKLAHLHEDMYFGDSRESIGIQLADLCAFIIACHLRGVPKTEKCYDLFKNNIWFKEMSPRQTAMTGTEFA